MVTRLGITRSQFSGKAVFLEWALFPLLGDRSSRRATPVCWARVCRSLGAAVRDSVESILADTLCLRAAVLHTEHHDALSGAKGRESARLKGSTSYGRFNVDLGQGGMGLHHYLLRSGCAVPGGVVSCPPGLVRYLKWVTCSNNFAGSRGRLHGAPHGLGFHVPDGPDCGDAKEGRTWDSLLGSYSER